MAADPTNNRKPSDSVQGPAPTRILVVEDDARLARGIARLLRRYEVRTVHSAPHALEVLRQGSRFEAILCDLRMPDMDGMEFYQRVRTSFPSEEKRIVFMTGGPTSPELARFMASVTNPVLEKPFTWETLETAIATCFGNA